MHPDGAAWNVDDTILRARYRDGYDKQVFMTEGEVYELRPTPMSTSYLFRAGHRLRVEVSSSKFPQYMRNLNTRGNNVDETEGVIAINTLHHSEAYPSRVELSVVPWAGAFRSQGSEAIRGSPAASRHDLPAPPDGIAVVAPLAVRR